MPSDSLSVNISIGCRSQGDEFGIDPHIQMITQRVVYPIEGVVLPHNGCNLPHKGSVLPIKGTFLYLILQGRCILINSVL